jgi:hypothetical protein
MIRHEAEEPTMQLHTEISIEATPEEVWAVLVDLERHREWNPFITEAQGEVEVGARLQVRLAPPGGRPVTLKPTVTVVEPARTLEWLGHLGIPHLFDGRHRFELHRDESATRVVQSETFGGILVPLFARMLRTKTLAGFEAMNTALRDRVVQQHHTTTGG